MNLRNDESERLELLIIVKTYPQPSTSYREVVCTAGVTRDGDFVRLYPINFRTLNYAQQFRKYEWIALDARKHVGRDFRKESYRPDIDSIEVGDFIPTRSGNWDERAKFALAKVSQSLEHLNQKREEDTTSLGVFRPKSIDDLEVTARESPDWTPSQASALLQLGFWDNPKARNKPLRKVPFDFHYRFKCDDSRCNGHRISIHDWEAGVLYWKLVDDGAAPDEAAAKVKSKFLNDLCGEDKSTHFFVGTMLEYPNRWIVLGLFYPKIGTRPLPLAF